MAEVDFDRACKIDGPEFDTGLRVQGLEVWAKPPNRYAHCLLFQLRRPGLIETEVVYRDGSEYQRGWEIVCPFPGGGHQVLYGAYKTEDEARHWRVEYGKERHQLSWRFNVFYTRTGLPDGSFCEKSEGVACGVVPQADADYCWSGFNIQFSPEEAQAVLDYSEAVSLEFQQRQAKWITAENHRTLLIAHATASESLPKIPEGLHCLECGATYDEPGHVEFEDMGCDKCNA